MISLSWMVQIDISEELEQASNTAIPPASKTGKPPRAPRKKRATPLVDTDIRSPIINIPKDGFMHSQLPAKGTARPRERYAKK